ncbi:MAG: tail fiber domain-containing protein [Bacteroidales bacterium]|nr:tail fiber domain-containing protein [Bacteroidales bacterium]
MKNLLFLLFLAISPVVHAQVAINTDGSNPDNSSMLDVKSTSKGLLIPRLTLTQLNAIVSPATGLLVFCTDNNQFFSNFGTPGSPYWSAMNSQWITNGNHIAYTTGNVGIGTAIPATLFDINGGNNWDVVNGEGDFRIGNGLYRLKMGVAINGGGAGAAGIMQAGQEGGYNVLSLGSQGHNLLFLNGGTQRVGIGTDNPATSFDVHGTFSVVDGTQGAGKVLTSDAAGKTSWTNSSASNWSLTGNAGTSPGSNFIGTTDNNPLVFKVNNLPAGKIDQMMFNTSFGVISMYSNTTGSGNTAQGFKALYANSTGSYNTAIGMNALPSNSSGYSNTALGSYALYSNTTGAHNTASGSQSMYLNTTGADNTATGAAALYENSTGSYNTATGFSSLTSNTTGNNNTSTGYNALYYNTTGYENTADGVSALYFNTTGFQNTAVGMQSLYSNTTGIYNTSVGWQSMYANTTGGWNTATGYWALSLNTDGFLNTATGVRALTLNTIGSYNTATGTNALSFNTEGFQNTAVGVNSIYFNTLGAYNTAVGYNTGPVSGMLYNTTCIGIDAMATGSDMVRIGNTFVGSIGGYQNWTNISDGRVKENVKEDVPGLSFITQLRPVTYRLNRERISDLTGITASHSKINEKDNSAKFYTGDQYGPVTTGFVAQEVEIAAQNIGFDFSGVDKPQNENSLYGLRYAEFVVPLVKAVQELNAKFEAQEKTNLELKQINEELRIRNEQLMRLIDKAGH